MLIVVYEIIYMPYNDFSLWLHWVLIILSLLLTVLPNLFDASVINTLLLLISQVFYVFCLLL